MKYYFSRLFSILLALVICGVLTSGFCYQLITDREPCPLCFLQRAAMIGVATGQLLNFRFGIHLVHHTISLFHAIFGAIVALRHICLHICDVASLDDVPVFGLKLYTWSFIVMMCSMVVIGVLLLIYNSKWKPLKFPIFQKLEKIAAGYLFILLIGNITNIVLQQHINLIEILN